jgi:hypothetical protein
MNSESNNNLKDANPLLDTVYRILVESDAPALDVLPILNQIDRLQNSIDALRFETPLAIDGLSN